jgi:hypothetical protein
MLSKEGWLYGGGFAREDKVLCKYIRKLLQVLYESILGYSNQQE